MKSLIVRNVTAALSEGLWWLKVAGEKENSRNGPVIVSPCPVMTETRNPCERVIFYPGRDANPFFHLFESIWMLAGSNDVVWLAQFNPRMLEYSDNNNTLHGAYGYRWVRHFGVNQIHEAIDMLQRDNGTRRAVIAMWDPRTDLGSASNDLPCNTHIYFRVQKGELEMTVCCRSNDAVWGAHGANAVHFSMLHELVARACGLNMGCMRQFSNNYHIYERHWDMLKNPPSEIVEPYSGLPVIPLLTPNENYEDLLLDCEKFVQGANLPMVTNFMATVALPMLSAWHDRKHWQRYIATMPDCDWELAASEWLIDKENNHNSKQ